MLFEPGMSGQLCSFREISLISTPLLYRSSIVVSQSETRKMLLLFRLFIGVGAQSTLGGLDIFARKICMKN